MLMIGQFSEPRYCRRLDEESKTHGLSYLSYLFLPARGHEGVFVEVGAAPQRRQVVMIQSPAGRAEAQWPADTPYADEQAVALLQELELFRQDSRNLAERLHSTICQSLTAAHLHLELGLMTTPGEDYETARQLLHEGATSVRELIDELSGESES